MAKGLASAMLEQIRKEEAVPPAYVDPPNPEITNWPLDLPHVVLPVHLTHWLQGPFMMSGDRYLLTNCSREFARKKIAAERNLDARISHLTEACDMPYLRNKADGLQEIERLLNL